MSEKSSAGCLKGLGVGCGSCFVLVVIVAVSVWAGWGSIREMGIFRRLTSTVEMAKSEAANMTGLRASLLEVYPAARIDVRADIQSTNGITAKTLAVAIVNPRFELPVSDPEKEVKAREIAARIAALYPSLDLYDQLRISLVSEGDGGASLGSTSNFQFATSGLLPAPTTEP
jgi:hypothetical protein